MPDQPCLPMLDRVRLPSDLKSLSDRELHQLADELRAETISAVVSGAKPPMGRRSAFTRMSSWMR